MRPPELLTGSAIALRRVDRRRADDLATAVAAKLGFSAVDRVAVEITSPGEAGVNQIWRLTR